MHVDKVISQPLLSCVILHQSSYIFSFHGARHFLCGSWWLHFCACYGVPRRSICQNTHSRVLLLVKYTLDGPDITFQKCVVTCFCCWRWNQQRSESTLRSAGNFILDFNLLAFSKLYKGCFAAELFTPSALTFLPSSDFS